MEPMTYDGNVASQWPTHILAVAGLVRHPDGRVLLVKSQHRGWEFPGGQVERGENLEEALLREIREEAGVIARVQCLAGLYSNVQEYTWHDGVTRVPPKLMVDFLCEYVDGDLKTSDETSGVIWCAGEEALELITHPALQMRMRDMLTFNIRVHYRSYSSQPFVQHFERYF